MSTAVITGATSGIGKAFAEKLAGKGYNLIIISRKQDSADKTETELKNKFNVNIRSIIEDLGTHEGLNKIYAHLEKENDIEFLVHAAGYGTTGNVEELEPDLLENQIYLHDVAGTLLARAVIPGMVKRNKGRIIFISSLAAFMTTADFTVYSATKVFLNMLSRGLKVELSGTNVKSLAVCPGLVKTDFWNNGYFDDSDYTKAPDSFWLSPEEVADESLAFIEKRNKPVMIAGRSNRAFVRFLNIPLIGTAANALMMSSSEKKVAKKRFSENPE